MLPPLTEHRFLPSGVHDASLADVEVLFGVFQHSERRRRLFAKLTEYVDEVRRAAPSARVVVDGSFVMAAVDEPEDIDVILVLPGDWDMSAELRPFEYNLISRRRTQRFYGFDVFAVRSGSPEEANLLEFFQQVGPKWRKPFGLPAGLRKGIIRIAP